MIGHGNGWHALPFDNANQLLDVTGTIEKGVIGMAVKVNERPLGHGRFILSLAAEAKGRSVLRGTRVAGDSPLVHRSVTVLR
jgi:hypothetical protein